MKKGAALFVFSNFFNINAISNIQNVKFIENECEQGGAIFLNNAILNISFSLFYRNKAKFGGAIYYFSLELLENSFSVFIVNSIFLENLAEEAGGCVNWNRFKPNIEKLTNIFLNNSSPYGKVMGSFPIKIDINIFDISKNEELSIPNDGNLFLTDVQSGALSQYEILLKKLDIDNQIYQSFEQER